MYHYGVENIKIFSTNGLINTKININVISLLHVPGHILGLQLIESEHEWDHAGGVKYSLTNKNETIIQ